MQSICDINFEFVFINIVDLVVIFIEHSYQNDEKIT